MRQRGLLFHRGSRAVFMTFVRPSKHPVINPPVITTFIFA